MIRFKVKVTIIPANSWSFGGESTYQRYSWICPICQIEQITKYNPKEAYDFNNQCEECDKKEVAAVSKLLSEIKGGKIIDLKIIKPDVFHNISGSYKEITIEKNGNIYTLRHIKLDDMDKSTVMTCVKKTVQRKINAKKD